MATQLPRSDSERLKDIARFAALQYSTAGRAVLDLPIRKYGHSSPRTSDRLCGLTIHNRAKDGVDLWDKALAMMDAKDQRALRSLENKHYSPAGTLDNLLETIAVQKKISLQRKLKYTAVCFYQLTTPFDSIVSLGVSTC
jgi:hypothetical protein